MIEEMRQAVLTPPNSWRCVPWASETPVRASRVVRLPPIGDAPGIKGAPPIRRKRVDVVVSVQQDLLNELGAQAARVAAVGLVGIDFAQFPMQFRTSSNAAGDVVEVVATGVPVTSVSTAQPRLAFRTAIDAVGVVELLRAGWVPVDLLVAGTTQIRSRQHRAADAEAATGMSNREIPGPTDMIQRARRVLRERLHGAAQSLGADGVLLHGGFDVTWSSTYHLVQVAAIGNAIARYDREDAPPTVTLSLAQAR